MRKPNDIPEEERDYYLEENILLTAILVRDISSRAAKEAIDDGRGAQGQDAVYLDFKGCIDRLGKKVIEERYGNLFEIYETITGDNPYESPMKIYPAPHYTMGGLWVDYNLMSTVQVCLLPEKPTSQITAQTVLVPVRSCKVWLMVILLFLILSGIISPEINQHY